jgi:hypothetical protein
LFVARSCHYSDRSIGIFPTGAADRVFDNLGLSKPAQYLYLVCLVFAFGIAFYWTVTNTGLSQPLIWLQSKIFFGRYFGVLTVFLAALPIALGGLLLAYGLDAILKQNRGS